MTPTFCFLIGFKNWRLEHLARSLASICRQTAERIVVADLGSEPGTLGRVTIICGDHDAKLVVHPADVWSRSLALNVAARNAGECDWLVATDADMIFEPRWVEVARANAKRGRLPLTRSRDTEPDAPFDFLLRMSTLELFDHTTQHPDTGLGGAMVIPRDWFFKVRGFEEVYERWGCDDTDMVHRATLDGLNVGWMENTFVVHQHHDRMAPPEVWEVVTRNRAYLAERFKERGPVIRNPKGWGGIGG